MPLRTTGRATDDGFTLIELLVAIVVLAVLSTIVVFGVSQFRAESVDAACDADLHKVRTAATAYEVRQGTYPESLDDLESAGYIRDPAAGVTFTFEAATETVTLVACDR